MREKERGHFLSFLYAVFSTSFLLGFFFSLHNKKDKQRLSRTSAARSGIRGWGHCAPTPWGALTTAMLIGVLILLCEDAHQSRGQEQQDQRVLELKNREVGGILSRLMDIRAGLALVERRTQSLASRLAL